ncbi:DNA repair protein RadA [Ruania halotolerans]|uniref:DNA repair protein RadA n=1 Tax=Ruania halotolerans TaxID=2897773 RepID=UPI001E3FDEC7|nr:DNA repair protein RadA [Ruania halotolerans]UFU05838.1 DNA repair protein RadA [Ruania halotolerans]
MRAKSTFVCGDCGAEFGKWYGRCQKCGAYATIEEAAPTTAAGLKSTRTTRAPVRPARRVREIEIDAADSRLSTGLRELDRVLGGGLVPGQVVLLAGEPGAGKSTLLLTAADAVAAATGRPVLYVSGEESVQQLATRARRIGAADEHLLLADSNELSETLGHLEALDGEPALMIVDSVQAIASAEVDGRAGGVAQVMEVASTLTRLAKARNLPMLLVGQVTKESTLAGPRALEHIADTTLAMEGDKQTPLRMLRTIKNRFGPADEVACFEQTDGGIVEVADPSSLFRSLRASPVPGTCLTVTVEGRRPMIAEMQALVSPSTAPNPRRGVSGLDTSRVSMLIAITERLGGVRLHDKDVFTATVGGMRSTDPATDLAVCLAIASAVNEIAIPLDFAAIGEVSLSGDIRRVGMMTQRLAEAARLGYRRMLVPIGTSGSAGRVPENVELLEVATIHNALFTLEGLRPAAPERRSPTTMNREKGRLTSIKPVDS